MADLRAFIAGALALFVAGCAHAVIQPTGVQPIIDLHRHTPWPGDPDNEGLVAIQKALRQHHVVASALFITGREDIALYRSNEHSRFLLNQLQYAGTQH